MNIATGQSGDLADELGAVLARLYAFLRRTILPGEMSLTQALALGTLRDLGPLRVTELAELEGVRQPTCTGLVNRLEEEGWVVRRVGGEDRRAVMVELTPAGRGVLDSITEARRQVLEEHLAALTSKERRALSAAVPGLKRLVDAGTEPAQASA